MSPALTLILFFLLYTIGTTGVSFLIRWRVQTISSNHSNHSNDSFHSNRTISRSIMSENQRIIRMNNEDCHVRGWISEWNGYRWDCCPSRERSTIHTHPTTYLPIEVPFVGDEKEAHDSRSHLTVCKYASPSGVFCLISGQCVSRICRSFACA